MTSRLTMQQQRFDLFINYSLTDQTSMQHLLLQPMVRAGLRIMTDHRQQPYLLDRANHPMQQSQAVLLAMSAASYKNMLAYGEMLRYSFEQLTTRLPSLWVVLLDRAVPRDQVSSFTLWDLSAEADQVHQVERLIRRLSGPPTIALLAPPDLESEVYRAHQLGARLRRLGHSVVSTPTGNVDWPAATREAIATSDYLLMFLSEMSVRSDLLAALVASAHDQFLTNRRPRIIPILQAGVSLPARLAGYMERWPIISWDGAADHRLFRLVAQAITLGGAPSVGKSNSNAVSFPAHKPGLRSTRSFDHEPPVYIERGADRRLQRILGSEPGTTTTIQGIYGTGKTTLLRRALTDVQGRKILLLDVPSIDPIWLDSFERLSRYIAMRLAETADLDQQAIDASWSDTFSSSTTLTRLLEQAILPQQAAKLVLAIDDADWLLDKDYRDTFFGLIRSWHNNRARNPVWQKLDLVLTIATDPHLLIRDTNQSPFNVGEKIYLDDFDVDEVARLSQFYHPALSDAELDQLYDLLGGQPGLTTQALVSLSHQRSASIADLWELWDHIRACRWSIGNSSALRQALHEVIEQGRCTDEREFYRLVQLGVARGDDPRDCAPRCQWYADQLADIL